MNTVKHIFKNKTFCVPASINNKFIFYPVLKFYMNIVKNK
jgi:hypothetical protein